QSGAVPFPRLDQRTGKPLLNQLGQMMFVQAQSDLDMETLQQIADRTGGRFFHARNIRELENVYAEIDELEKTEIDVRAAALYRDRFIIPLALCLALYLLDWT